jgi:hypothetical protein
MASFNPLSKHNTALKEKYVYLRARVLPLFYYYYYFLILCTQFLCGLTNAKKEKY